jgi:peptide/nickel transport system substrate-binding protein
LVSAGNYNALILKSDYSGNFTKHPVGTGPFLLQSYDASTGAILVRNPSYWQHGKPYLDGVNVRFYSDSQAQQIALQSGELHTLIETDPAAIVASGDVVLDTVPSTIMTAFTLRVDKAPFDKKEVRQAIAYALDRPAINRSTNGNLGALGDDHPLAPLFKDHPTDVPQRNLDQAKVAQLLREAGVDRLSFPLTFDPPSKNYALVIQDQLRRCGIEVTLDERSSAEFYGGDQSADTPWLFTHANLVGWAGRAVPSQFINPMVTTNGVWNGSKYANPQLDAALKAYDAANDDRTRRRQAEIIASALYEDVPVIISLWQGAARAYNRTRFSGIQAHPSSYVDFTSVSRLR